MPPLLDQRQEAFAQARVRGMDHKAAYAWAGFAPDRSNGSKLAKRVAIRKRIDELTTLKKGIELADLPNTINLVRAQATMGEQLGTAAGLKEARNALLEAYKLRVLLDREEAQSLRPPEPELTRAEWAAKYGPRAPGG